MLQTDDILGIIPARMASTRFPGKPLVRIGDLPMVIRVYREVTPVLKNLIIATGDQEIAEVAEQFGASCILTTADHLTGTSRCVEALHGWLRNTGKKVKAVINIQGDEPMLTPTAVTLLAQDILRPEAEISTLIRPETDPVTFKNPNRVKVVINQSGYALYFSRSPIPYYVTAGDAWYSHIGMYAFKSQILEQISHLKPGDLEKAESLEQLRWLENGLSIHCCETGYRGFGVDTPEDLEELIRSGLI
jgi:3-deoxy-manno-octulosonate cytidylyltransferase (CMP-KDO synthetase)